MIDHSFVEFARKYIECSDAHDLDEIQKMFLDNASYESIHVGKFVGWEEISIMMRDFFDLVPDVRWQVHNFDDVEDNVVEFTFLMRGTDRKNGGRIERRGVERIQFTDSGRICHVEVR